MIHQRVKMDQVSWLHLHKYIPKDIRKIIYGMLNKHDRSMVMIAHGINWKSTHMFSNYCAEKGYLNLLKWLYKNNTLWEDDICSLAARKGHLHILQWASANGCPRSRFTCAYAASKGHWDILYWAKTNGLPFDDILCCLSAAVNGQREILIKAKENGWIWDKLTCEYDDHNGYLNVITWGIQKGYVDILNILLENRVY